MYHCKWEIEGKLARVGRPGRGLGKNVQIDAATVDAWVKEARDKGIESVICLLGDDQLPRYSSVPGGLVEYYRASGLDVAHVPTSAAPPMKTGPALPGGVVPTHFGEDPEKSVSVRLA